MDELVQVAVQNALRIADLDVGAVVLDQLVRVQDIAPNLTSEVGLLHRTALLGQLRFALLLLQLGEP